MKTSPRTKYLFTALSILIILLAGVIYIGPSILIKKRLSKLEVGNYLIIVGNAHASLINQSITLKNVEVKEKSNKQEIRIHKISLIGLNIPSILKRQNIIVDKIKIESPEIFMRKGSEEASEEVNKKETTKNQLPTFQVNQFIVEKGSFLLQDSLPANDSILWLNFDAALTDIHLVNDTARSIKDNLSINDVQIDIQNLNQYLDGRNYQVSIDNCSFHKRQQQLEITNTKIIPLVSKYEIGRQNGSQTTWYNASAAKVLISGIELEHFIAQDTIAIHSIRFDKVNFEAFKDKRLPFPVKPDTKLFADLLLAPTIPYNCDSIIIRNSNIHYSERAEESQKSGFIDFNDLNAEILCLTNRSNFYDESPTMHAEVKIMNNAKLKVDFKFPAPAKNVQTRVTGQVWPMPFHHLNSIVEPSTGVHIESGEIKRLMFDFSYSDNISTGNLILDYENLKIKVFDRSTKRNKDIKSLLANTLIVHEKNKPEQKHYRSGKIYFERDKKKSFVNYWWKSVFSGIKSVVVN